MQAKVMHGFVVCGYPIDLLSKRSVKLPRVQPAIRPSWKSAPIGVP